MTYDESCPFHVDHGNRIMRNENDLQDLWQRREADRTENNDAHSRIHGRIDHMKNWVIAGMGTFIVQCIIVVTNFLIQWINRNGGNP